MAVEQEQKSCAGCLIPRAPGESDLERLRVLTYAKTDDEKINQELSLIQKLENENRALKKELRAASNEIERLKAIIVKFLTSAIENKKQISKFQKKFFGGES